MIAAATKFIKLAINDGDLRGSLEDAADNGQRQELLREAGLDFSFDEFDEAYHALLSSAQTRERGEELEQIRLWWEMLLQL